MIMIVVCGECGFRSEVDGAGEGNRTLVFSLEGCCSWGADEIEVLEPRRDAEIGFGAEAN